MAGLFLGKNMAAEKMPVAYRVLINYSKNETL
jgi:hypothetical protein